jgi:nucleoside-diphosphate-sugar epimerase
MTDERRILVTGAAGYLGKRIGYLLSDKQIPFVATARNGDDRIEACNLENADAVTELVSNLKIGTVIHTAACVPKTGEGYSDEEAAASSLSMVENLIGSGIERLVFTSSMTVYPETLPLPVHEEDAPESGDGYGGGKRRAETALMAAGNLSAIILRLPGLFGPPRQNGILYNVALALSSDTAPKLPENPPLWAAMHVDDAADLCVRAAVLKKSESVIINAGYRGVFSLSSAINDLAALFDKPPLCSTPAPEFEMELSRLTERLGLPKFTFKQRLKELAFSFA